MPQVYTSIPSQRQCSLSWSFTALWRQPWPQKQVSWQEKSRLFEISCKSTHSSGLDELASLPRVIDHEVATAMLAKLPPQAERWLLAPERRSSLAGAALTAAMTSPGQISASTKCSSTLGWELHPYQEGKSNKHTRSQRGTKWHRGSSSLPAISEQHTCSSWPWTLICKLYSMCI